MEGLGISMQTFLPYADYDKSAKVLDTKRLNRQISEVMFIHKVLDATLEESLRYRFRNHPAIGMWRGHTGQLLLYGNALYNEWQKRFPNKPHASGDYIRSAISKLLELRTRTSMFKLPSWLKDERLHKSHRSNLLRKNKVHYGQYFGDEPDNLAYFWPTKEIKNENHITP